MTAPHLVEAAQDFYTSMKQFEAALTPTEFAIHKHRLLLRLVGDVRDYLTETEER